jgi:hypothetical protein
MKFLRSVVLVSCLMAAPTFLDLGLTAQQKPAIVEYDAGVCGEKDFQAIHLVISKDKLIVNQIATGPHNTKKTEDDVWKLSKTDKDGTLHFVEDDRGTHFELVLKQDNKLIEGMLLADGRKTAKFYGFVADGTKLQESSLVLYQMCLQLWESPKGPLNES